MKILKIGLAAISLTAATQSCEILNQLPNIETNLPLTEAEVSSGLKEALKVGIRNAVVETSAENGYYGNALIKIPFPEEAGRVKTTLTDIGMGSLIQNFEESMNHAAEQASAQATDIFVDAITQMTIQDAMGILHGNDDAATAYLRRTTETRLNNAFRPIIDNALQQGNVTQYWNQITTRYNQIPFVNKVNTDLTGYVTEAAMDGLFIMVAKEEQQIRENPQARINDILKRVFGSLDS
ncbi:MAG: DUF4197 domain-containing protein [Flavobacteriia bacterium]|nr:DUF4197 domain-containing protein [Flavobacteriia bacterium]